jgi:crotonobetainyl-CoA:carnitine CoA-transferase CaiB-like acyl-CoA transferase
VPQPLRDLLVVSLEQAVAAPLCTVRLADAGARVIKIEREDGDSARHYDGAVLGTSAYFAWLNRGKESVVLDLKARGGLDLLSSMLARADVFVQNLAPGACDRLGLGAEQLVVRHPRLIAVGISGYGGDTVYRDRRAYDMLVQAESGLCSVTGTEDTPSKVGVSVADICTGMNAHAAILEALLEREQSGRGRAISISMFDGMADWMAVPILHHDHLQRSTPRLGLRHASIYPYGTFSCRDGDVIVVVQNNGEWRRFCEGVIGRADLIDDERFRDNPARVRNRETLDGVVVDAFSRLDRREAIERLERQSLAWGNLASVAEAARHPALKRIRVRVPNGEFDCVAPPLHPDLDLRSVPELGEHTEAIRREFGAPATGEVGAADEPTS